MMQLCMNTILWFLVVIQVVSLFNLYGETQRHALLGRARNALKLTYSKPEPGEMPYYQSEEDDDDYGLDSDGEGDGSGALDDPSSENKQSSFEVGTNFRTKVIDIPASASKFGWEDVESPVIIYYDDKVTITETTTVPYRFFRIYPNEPNKPEPQQDDLVMESPLENSKEVSTFVNKEVNSNVEANLIVDDAPVSQGQNDLLLHEKTDKQEAESQNPFPLTFQVNF